MALAITVAIDSWLGRQRLAMLCVEFTKPAELVRDRSGTGEPRADSCLVPSVLLFGRERLRPETART